MRKLYLIPTTAVAISLKDVVKVFYMSIVKNNSNEEFKILLNKVIGYKYSELFPSGTVAMKELLTELSKSSIKKEVIIPAYSCPSIYYAVVAAELIPVLVDIEYETLSINPRILKPEINDNTLAIIVPHMFGKNAKLKQIKEISKDNNIILIEDMAQSLDNYSHNKNENACLGDYCVLSFARAKNISTIAGGAILSNNQETMLRINNIVDKYPIKSLNSKILLFLTMIGYAIVVHPYIYYWVEKFTRGDSKKNEDPFKLIKIKKRLIEKYKYTKIQSSLGIVLLSKISLINGIRIKNGQLLYNKINKFKNINVLANTSNLYLRFVILSKSKVIKDLIIKQLYSAGIRASTADFPVFTRLNPPAKNVSNLFPIACLVEKEILTLPTHSFVKESQLLEMSDIIERGNHNQA